MIRLWLAIAGLGGLAAVAAGALGAHLAAEPRIAELLRTGAIYGMVHATALIAVVALAQGREPRRGAAAVAGWSFAPASCCSAAASMRWPGARRAGSAG
jgi:uncharacterized membrane protein YgdD (TMEM256/DUF423 family)